MVADADRHRPDRAARPPWGGGWLRLPLSGVLVALLILGLPRLLTAFRYASQIHHLPEVTPAPVGIVFGAGLQVDGTPSLVLGDRMATAAELYQAGKVGQLLLSGDNRFANYNEPRAMYLYGQSLGLPPTAMALDYAGRRTYDTCRRAREVFGLTRAVLVTQRYHLDRALLTCEALGLDVQGVAADRHPYAAGPYRDWWLREWPATTQALWELFVLPPRNVVLADPLPLPPPRQPPASTRTAEEPLPP